MSALPIRLAALAAPVLLGGAALAASQAHRPYALPVEQAIALPAGPDADLVQAQCSACHSLDYVVTQPRGKGARFWQDTVAKMRNVFGAPLSEEDAARVSAYLARTYG